MRALSSSRFPRVRGLPASSPGMGCQASVCESGGWCVRDLLTAGTSWALGVRGVLGSAEVTAVPVRVEHTLEVVAICPVDNKKDVYLMTVRTSRTITVEAILTAVSSFAQEPVFQEDFTERLHRMLGCEVETVGYHSGVRTRVVCGQGPGA